MRRMLSVSGLVVSMLAGFAGTARAAVVFADNLDGTVGANIAGTVPDTGGNTWTQGGAQINQVFFAAGGGVEDVGPNGRNSHTVITSTFTSSYALSSLGAGEVLRLRVTMENLSSTPATNFFESTRVDLVTNSSGGFIYLGELHSGGFWAAVPGVGPTFPSGITTAQGGSFVLELYLDPNDAFGDGPERNAVLIVDGTRECGTIAGLSASTVVSALRLVRNVDDEVRFDDVSLESVPAPDWVLFRDDLDGTPGVPLGGTTPEVGGAAWVQQGLQYNELLFAAGGGVEDVGPNGSNTQVTSLLSAPFALSSLVPCEVLHLRVTMENIAGTPAANLLASTRVDLLTNTSGGFISLGELDTGGDWGASTFDGAPIPSGVTTGQSGGFVLDLYLDPNDEILDGPTFNAATSVNGGALARGTLSGLSAATTVSAVRLVRNVNDEVRFDDLVLETSCRPFEAPGVPAQPAWGPLLLALSLLASATWLFRARRA